MTLRLYPLSFTFYFNSQNALHVTLEHRFRYLTVPSTSVYNNINNNDTRVNTVCTIRTCIHTRYVHVRFPAHMCAFTSRKMYDHRSSLVNLRAFFVIAGYLRYTEMMYCAVIGGLITITLSNNRHKCTTYRCIMLWYTFITCVLYY